MFAAVQSFAQSIAEAGMAGWPRQLGFLRSSFRPLGIAGVGLMRWGRDFGTGTSHPSVPPRRPAPPPSSTPSPLPQSLIPTAPPAGLGKTPVPSYLRAALHREVASHAAAQRPQAIFETLWRYVDRFQPELMDLDACLHSLVKCNTESWSWQKFARKAKGKVVLHNEDLLRLFSHLQRELLHEHGRSSATLCDMMTSTIPCTRGFVRLHRLELPAEMAATSRGILQPLLGTWPQASMPMCASELLLCITAETMVPLASC